MFRKTIAVFAAALVAVAGALAFWQGDFDSIKSSHAVTSPPVAATGGRTLPDFATLVDQVGSAVVNISVVQKVRTAGGAPGLNPDDPFYEFFRQFQGQQSETPVQGQGSGFIVAADGTVLTNLMTGRPARGFINRVMREIGPINSIAPEFPLAGGALAPLNAKAQSQGSGDFATMWAGQAAALGQHLHRGQRAGGKHHMIGTRIGDRLDRHVDAKPTDHPQTFEPSLA